MERRLGRDPFSQSGLDKIFTPVVEQATTSSSKPKLVKAKSPGKVSSREVKAAPVPQASTSDSSSKGLPKGWTRATFIVRQDLLHKVKRAAYWDRKQIKDVLTEALDAYLIDKKTD
jgi:hypothetical protein